ncbi:cdc42 effector protein 4-like [Engraulis encrasicolus]|uniref:cdc42 effector protein 4-like n=1 Tax=Engraulis encrasicolus TaxID=184585 RepID=UPI002FD16305
MPILKQLVSGSSQSKRRSRADLTPEMISAPLGDFRHTMHVGRGGDTFGDTSFLASRSGEPPRQPTDTLPPPPPQHQYQMSHPQHPSQPPPPPPDSSPPTQHHKPSLLSRTFRSSKRSQSVNRAADKHKSSSSIMVSSATPTMLLPGNGSPTHVKTAISLPYLNEGGGGGGALSFPKSVSSSPLKRGMGSSGDVIDGRKPANGAAASAAALAIQEPDLLEAERERRFGDLSDLPPSLPRGGGGGGMKHAESIMSFHIDLGPSMLGDILSVMDKPAAWDCDDSDLGFEDGRGSPPLSPPRAAGNGVGGGVDHRANGHDDVVGGGGGGGGGRGGGASSDDNEAPSPPAPSRPPRITSSSSTSTSTSSSSSRYASNNGGGAVVRPPGGQHLDSCSVSSSGSTVQDDRMSGSIGGHSNHGYSNQRNQLNHSNQSETDGDSARFSSPGRSTTREEDRDFSFMDDDDEDEIRV